VSKKLFGPSEVIHRLRGERMPPAQPTLPHGESLAQERSGVGVVSLGVQQPGKTVPASGHGEAAVAL
jgi:hypothetical protein